eukprot:COSAG02_NODE_4973_length_4769_cov_62.553319_2_plen_47_part_00
MSAQWASLWSKVMKVEECAISLSFVTARHSPYNDGREFLLPLTLQS